MREELTRELRRVIANALPGRPAVTVGVVGSLAANVGTSTSDVDLWAIGDADDVRALSLALPPTCLGHRVDVETVSLDALVASLHDIDDASTLLPEVPTDRLYRLDRALRDARAIVHSHPLHDPEQAWTTMMRRARRSLAAARALHIARANVWVNNTAEDLLGLHRDGDLESLARRSHDQLELAIDMLLVRHGADQPDEKLKWVTRRLRTTPLLAPDARLLLRNYHPELAPEGADPRPMRGDVVGALAQVVRLRALLATLGLDAGDLPLEGDGDQRSLRVAPWLWVGSHDDAIVVAIAGESWEVPVTALMLLSLAMGRDRDRLVRDARRALAESTPLAVAAQTLDDVVGTLIEIGALRTEEVAA